MCLIIIIIFTGTFSPISANTYDSTNRQGLLGSTYYLSLGLEDEMVYQKLYQASVSLTLVTFDSNVHMLTEISLWLLVTDLATNEILKIQADEKGSVVSEGWAWVTSISYWTTNFPDQVIFSIGATFFEVDTGGGSNNNPASFVELHTYSFEEESNSRKTINQTEDDLTLSTPLIYGISTFVAFIVIRKNRMLN
ncbi:MAG: hypothetical protein ACW99Q_10545 [Candidatus Kariarchaeaceae archaeon]